MLAPDTALGFSVRYGGERAAFTSLHAGTCYLNLIAQPADRRWSWWGRVILHVSDVDAFHRRTPIGGFFGGDPSRAASEARLSAAVTHAHPEGQAGAMAVAAAAALSAGRGDLAGRKLIQETLPYVPAGETRNRIAASLDIPAEEFGEAVRVLGTGWEVSAQDTMPFCLWCAAHCLYDFEEAIWRTVAGMGDRDTTCAIVGGIVALSSRQVPAAWIAHREPLPEGFERA